MEISMFWEMILFTITLELWSVVPFGSSMPFHTFWLFLVEEGDQIYLKVPTNSLLAGSQSTLPLRKPVNCAIFSSIYLPTFCSLMVFLQQIKWLVLFKEKSLVFLLSRLLFLIWPPLLHPSLAVSFSCGWQSALISRQKPICLLLFFLVALWLFGAVLVLDLITLASRRIGNSGCFMFGLAYSLHPSGYCIWKR